MIRPQPCPCERTERYHEDAGSVITYCVNPSGSHHVLQGKTEPAGRLVMTLCVFLKMSLDILPKIFSSRVNYVCSSQTRMKI